MLYCRAFDFKFFNILHFLSEGMLTTFFIILDESKNFFQDLAKNPIR